MNQILELTLGFVIASIVITEQSTVLAGTSTPSTAPVARIVRTTLCRIELEHPSAIGKAATPIYQAILDHYQTVSRSKGFNVPLEPLRQRYHADCIRGHSPLAKHEAYNLQPSLPLQLGDNIVIDDPSGWMEISCLLASGKEANAQRINKDEQSVDGLCNRSADH